MMKRNAEPFYEAIARTFRFPCSVFCANQITIRCSCPPYSHTQTRRNQDATWTDQDLFLKAMRAWTHAQDNTHHNMYSDRRP